MKFKSIGNVLNTELWAATAGQFSFIIGHNEIGYSASYKDRYFRGSQSSHFIEGSPFSTRNEAEEACKAAWNKLRLS